jgi:ATP-dependent DNA helicase PIF1
MSGRRRLSFGLLIAPVCMLCFYRRAVQSWTLTQLVSLLKEEKRQFAVTASTGVAAVAINGRTIHSFAGIRFGQGSAEDLAGIMPDKARVRLRAVEVLLLDEISMISGDLFDKLDTIFRLVRENPSASFGGVQLVLSGDFLQLPPFEKAQVAAAPVRFAFESAAWRKCIPSNRVIVLNAVLRQSGFFVE